MVEMLKITEEELRESWKRFSEVRGVTYPEVTLKEVKPVVFPYRTKGSDRVEVLAPALLFRVENTDNKHHHTVVVSITPDKNFNIWCADGLFAAKRKATSKYERIYNEYESAVREKDIPEAYWIPPNLLFSDDGCSFWRRKTCKHTEFVLNLINTYPDRFYDYVEMVARDTGMLGEDDSVRISSLEKELLTLAFRSNVIVEGEQGSGKTYTSLAVAEKLIEEGKADEVVVVQGDNSVEGVDLLGYWIKAQDGSLVWKDGGVTEAFRKASKGKRVVLIVDEILRIRARERDLLVRALTVWKDGKYRLRTGRVLAVEDGVAQEEVIEVPRENLWVIGTTNIGSQFTVDEYDPAFAERFILLRADTTEDDLRRVLTEKCDELEFPPVVVGLLIKFWKSCKRMHESGELAGFPTTRTLVRALEIAPEKTVEGAKEGLWIQRYLWVGRDSMGYPIKEQEKLIERLLKEIFK